MASQQDLKQYSKTLAPIQEKSRAFRSQRIEFKATGLCFVFITIEEVPLKPNCRVMSSYDCPSDNAHTKVITLSISISMHLSNPVRDQL